MAEIEFLEVLQMPNALNRSDLVFLKRQFFQQSACLETLNFLNAIVHEVELTQIDEGVQVFDDANLLMRQVQDFDLLFPVLLSGVWIVLVLARRRPIIITIIIGALKQILPLVLDLLEDHLRA